MAFCAVKMNIEERGRERGAGKIEKPLGGRDVASGAGGNGSDLSVFDSDDGKVEQPGSIPKPLGGKHSAHNGDYCRRRKGRGLLTPSERESSGQEQSCRFGFARP